MAQTVVEASRDWQLNRIAGTEHASVVPLFKAPASAEAIPAWRGRRSSASTVSWQRVYHVSAASADVLRPLLGSVPHAAGVPHTKAKLTQFASQRFSREFGHRIHTLATARPGYGGHRLRVRSLRFALDFLAARHDAWRLPDEVLLPASGNLQVLWRSDRRRIVAQFLPEGIVWFTVLENGQPRLTGQVPPHEFAVQQGVQDAVRL